MTSRRRVWVTGIGAITAAGAGQAALLETLRHGRSGVRPDAVAGMPAGRAPEPPPICPARVAESDPVMSTRNS